MLQREKEHVRRRSDSLSCEFSSGQSARGVMSMKTRESQTRLKQFQVSEKTRQLNGIQMMMAEMEKMVAELEYQIASEEKKSGISDPSNYAYPTFAKAARTRAENLHGSIAELTVQLDAAGLALEGAEAEFEKATALAERDQGQRRVG